MYLSPALRRGTIDSAAQSAGHTLQLHCGQLIAPLNEEWHLTKIESATSRKGLERIEDTSAPLAQHIHLDTTCRMHHDSRIDRGQRSRNITYGTVAHADDIEVSLGSRSRILTPLGTRHRGQHSATFGVASHNLF
jgi:hypothetical protein